MINKIIGFALANWLYLLFAVLLIWSFKKVTHTVVKFLLIAVLVCIILHTTGFNITSSLKGLY